eukprot:6201326-Pleurochrysis_carterae.AAC.2
MGGGRLRRAGRHLKGRGGGSSERAAELNSRNCTLEVFSRRSPNYLINRWPSAHLHHVVPFLHATDRLVDLAVELLHAMQRLTRRESMLQAELQQQGKGRGEIGSA